MTQIRTLRIWDEADIKLATPEFEKCNIEIEATVSDTSFFIKNLWFDLSIEIIKNLFFFLPENIQCSTADRTCGYPEKYVFAFQEND